MQNVVAAPILVDLKHCTRTKGPALKTHAIKRPAASFDQCAHGIQTVTSIASKTVQYIVAAAIFIEFEYCPRVTAASINGCAIERAVAAFHYRPRWLLSDSAGGGKTEQDAIVIPI